MCAAPILALAKTIKHNKHPGPSLHITVDLTEMIQQLAKMFKTLSASRSDLKFVVEVIRLYKSELLGCAHLTLSAIDQLLEDSFAIQNLLLTLASPGDESDGITELVLTEMRKPIGILETMQSEPQLMVRCFANRVDMPSLQSQREFSQLLNAIGDLLEDDVKVSTSVLETVIGYMFCCRWRCICNLRGQEVTGSLQSTSHRTRTSFQKPQSFCTFDWLCIPF